MACALLFSHFFSFFFISESTFEILTVGIPGNLWVFDPEYIFLPNGLKIGDVDAKSTGASADFISQSFCSSTASNFKSRKSLVLALSMKELSGLCHSFICIFKSMVIS